MKTQTQNEAAGKPALSVAFLLLPEFTLFAFSAFIDTLRLAADEADLSRQIHCRWTIMGIDESPVTSSCGVKIFPWDRLRNPAEFDYVVVVGGLLRGHKRIDRRVLDYLRLAGSCGTAFVGICTGSFALTRAGLMNGYRCCVHWYHLRDFINAFPRQAVETDNVYVIDRNRITCAGGQGSVDVANYLVEKHCGRKLARKVTAALVMEVTRGPKQPQPHAETNWFQKISDALVQRAILLMDQSVNQRLSSAALAADLCVSTSTLERAFINSVNVSPAAFFRLLRLAHGHWDVLHTNKPIGNIAGEFGFADASHFTVTYQKYYGSLPSAVRRMAKKGLDVRLRCQTNSPVIRQILKGDLFLLERSDWSEVEPYARGGPSTGLRI